MINRIKNRNNNDIRALFTSLIITIIGFALAQRLFFSKYTMMLGDLYELYVPLYRMFISKIFEHGDLLGAGSIFYSFRAGYGLDISPYISCEAFFSPFNIWFLIFKNNDLATSALIISKLAFSSFFFQRYLRRVHDIDGLPSIAWSVVYSLCGYSTIFFLNIQFLEGVVVLPIVITLCYEYIKEKCSVIKLAFMYLYTFVNGFYSGYIIGIFSFLFFILSFLLLPKEERKLNVIWGYIRAVVYAFLMSAVLIIPAAISILSGTAEDKTLFSGHVATLFNSLGNVFIGMNQGFDSLNPYLYSGIIVIFLVPLMFISKSIDKKKKILWGGLLLFMILCLFVPFFYIMMHCFDNPDTYIYRFTYIVSFLLITISAIVLKNVKKYSMLYCAIIGILSIGYFSYLMGVVRKSDLSMFTIEVNVLFIIIVGYILVSKKEDKSVSKMLYILICIESLVNFYMISINTRYSVMNYREIANKIENDLDSTIETIKNQDKDIYRIYIPNAPNLNYNLTSDIYRGQFFGTFEDAKTRNTMYHMGMLTTARFITDYGINAGTEMILGYKYNIYSNGVVIDTDIESPVVEECDYYLGIGYMTSSSICDVEFENTYNPFENINAVLSAMVNHKVEYFVDDGIALNMVSDGLTAQKMETGYDVYTLQDGHEVGMLATAFEGEGNYYAYIPIEKTIYIESSPIAYSIGGDHRILTIAPYVYSPKIIRLGKNEKGLNNIVFQVDKTDLYPYFVIKDLYLYRENSPQLKIVYDELKDNVLEINTIKDGYITGSIYATPEKDTLFLSIPYDDNWQMKVDGEVAEITPGLNDTFITCKLTPGKHDIELKYRNPYVAYGGLISLFGIFVIIVEFLYSRRHKKVKCIN